MDPQVCNDNSGTGIRHRDVHDLCRTCIKRSLSHAFGIGFANVVSGSMEPALKKGTLLLVRKRQMQKSGTL